jgi:hypothetical protein
MTGLLPVDLTGILYSALTTRRESSGKLRCSSELLGPLRHAQLRVAGAPTIASELVSEIRLRGTDGPGFDLHAGGQRNALAA